MKVKTKVNVVGIALLVAAALSGCGSEGSGSEVAVTLDHRLQAAAAKGNVWHCSAGSQELAFSVEPFSLSMSVWSLETGRGLVQRDFVIEEIYDALHSYNGNPAEPHRAYVPLTTATQGKLTPTGPLSSWPSLWLTDRWEVVEVIGAAQISGFRTFSCSESEYSATSVSGEFLSGSTLL